MLAANGRKSRENCEYNTNVCHFKTFKMGQFFSYWSYLSKSSKLIQKCDFFNRMIFLNKHTVKMNFLKPA